MSNELSYVLQTINNNVNAVGNEVAHIQKNMEVLYNQASETQGQVANLDQKLLALIQEFLAFVDSDKKSKSLQLSETRIVKVRQELEHKFGHYNEVRRVSQSIMQTLDSGVLNEKVLRDVSDELMLKTPKYWLAAATVALSAWINDDKPLAETALQEAFSRDDYKTSLFFTLICNRLNRPAATLQWVERYFQHQNPSALDREFVVILNAIAGGIFPAQSATIAVDKVHEWLQILGNEKQIEDSITQRWMARFATMHGKASQHDFPTLSQTAINFPEFKNYLELTSTFQEQLDFIHNVFTTNFSKGNLVQKIDELLVRLTRDFDDEELPMHREERLLTLIIESNGDETIARNKFNTETQIFDSNVDILQILTNTAMNPDKASADILTQRLSLTLSKSYVLKAHASFVHKVRGSRPTEAQLKVDTFQGLSTDGRNELELVKSFQAHMIKERDNQLQLAKLQVKDWLILAGAGVGLILAVAASSIFWGFVGAGLGVWFWTIFAGIKSKKEDIQRNYKGRTEAGIQQLKTCCAELVDYFSLIEKCNPAAEEFQQQLNSFIPENSISSDHRKIVA